MKFTYTFPLPVPADQAWASLQDPTALIRCLPGVEEVELQPDGRFAVGLVVGLGPVRLRFRGTARLEFDAAALRMQADVTMNDARSGNVYGQFVMAIGATATGSELQLTSDVVIGGKLGEFAQPLLKRKADQVVKEFAEALQRLVNATDASAENHRMAGG